MPSYLDALRMPDYIGAKQADTITQNEVNRIPQTNRAQDLAIQGAEQEVTETGRKNAAGLVSRYASAVAESASPMRTAQQVFQNPQFLSAAEALGFKRDMFRIDPTDNDETIKSSALNFARATGGLGGGGTAALDTFAGMTRGLAPEQRDRAARINLGLESRAGMTRVIDVNGVPTLTGVMDDGSTPFQVPLSSLSNEVDATSQLARGARAGQEAATTAAIPGQVAAKTRSERYAAQIDDGLSASDTMPIINRSLELLASVKTSGIERAKLSATDFLGVTGADEAELSQNLGKAVLRQLRATFGAQFTEREGARLDSIEANFGKSTEGNIRLLEQLKKIVEREAVRGMNAARYTDDADSARLIQEGLDFRLTTETEMQEGIEYTNDAGEIITLRNGQVVKVR